MKKDLKDFIDFLSKNDFQEIKSTGNEIDELLKQTTLANMGNDNFRENLSSILTVVNLYHEWLDSKGNK